MSTASDTLQLTTTQRSNSDQSCSLCGSAGQFGCLGHCEAIFCAQCTSKHRAIVIQQMRELLERLKMYRLYLPGFLHASKTNSIPITDTPEQPVDNEINSSLTLVTNDSLLVYLNILEEHTKYDRLLHAKTLADLDTRLSVRTALITRNLPSLTTSHNFDTHKLLIRRSRVRPHTAKVTYSKTVSVSLNVQKHFQVPVQSSFSVGQHPVVVSLIDHYLETSFFQWRQNSVILLSLLSVDVYNRGSGLIWSIPLGRVWGNIKDTLLAGAWCSYIQRLILVGRYHFYVFDIDRQKVRCVCECGCGGRCGSGPMPPKTSLNTTLVFRCQLTYNDQTNSKRFLVCSHNRYLFYAYKSGTDTYRLEVYDLTFFSDVIDQEQGKRWSMHDLYPKLIDKKMTPIRSLSINGQLGAICVTHDRLACVYRRYRRTEKSIPTFRNSFEIDHYFILLDHSLTKLTDDVLLSSSIRWVTAIVSRGTDSEYLLCDPRGQQLLLYQAIDDTFIRRFHIGPVNACCLTDGRLVLWIQKSYASTPIGKLHFISPPHLENYSSVATSSELLKKSHV